MFELDALIADRAKSQLNPAAGDASGAHFIKRAALVSGATVQAFTARGQETFVPGALLFITRQHLITQAGDWRGALDDFRS